VVVHCPCSVEVDLSVNPAHIARGVVVHAGCRIRGSSTSVGPGCVIGAEGPATLEDCQPASGVELKGGYFSGAVFLDKSSLGSCAHVRPGMLLEEEASGGHAVGLKQTILLPFVTTGSLINFCDCLMSGGTSRENHSEIGSSFVHFNFTLHGDKATASLIGDVPRGVMLDRPPIFLGGQGGLVGPVRIEYGCVLAAGTVYRRDALQPNHLLGAGESWESRPYRMNVHRNTDRIIRNNLIYIGNLRALESWYRLVRTRTMDHDPFAAACREGALKAVATDLEERIKRLGELARKLVASVEALKASGVSPEETSRQQAFIDRWPSVERHLRTSPADGVGAACRDAFLAEWDRVPPGARHVQAVRQLSPKGKQTGTEWLQSIVDSVSSVWGGP